MSHSSSSSLFCSLLSQDHTQEPESWKPIRTLSAGYCYLFSCLKASFKDTHNWVFLLCSGFRIRADSRTNKFSHWISKTKKVYGLQWVREENCASIIIQRELLHRGELGTAQKMRMHNVALTKLIMHSETKVPSCVQREEITTYNWSNWTFIITDTFVNDRFVENYIQLSWNNTVKTVIFWNIIII